VSRREAKIPNVVIPDNLDDGMRRFCEGVFEELTELREKTAAVSIDKAAEGTSTAHRVLVDKGSDYVDIEPSVMMVCTTSWTGNGANGRLIAVTDDRTGTAFTPDWVSIRLDENKSYNTRHLDEAWYMSGAYGVEYSNNDAMRGRVGASANDYYQGVSGTDLVLGAAGSNDDGTNNSGWGYKAIAIKFGDAD